MSFLRRFFSGSAPTAPASTSHAHSQLATEHSQSSVAPAASQNATRRELLRVVLRDTLQQHGIPVAWIAGETLLATSRQHAVGIHWRLVIKHWDPRLLAHGVAFQQALIKRVMTFDPLASAWLLGISWQFQLPDESVCPALPQASVWTAEPSSAKADLDKAFAVRDADRQRHEEDSPDASAYAATRPAYATTEPARL